MQVGLDDYLSQRSALFILVLQEMEKLQAKGEIPVEELQALEMDVTGKVTKSLPITRSIF